MRGKRREERRRGEKRRGEGHNHLLPRPVGANVQLVQLGLEVAVAARDAAHHEQLDAAAVGRVHARRVPAARRRAVAAVGRLVPHLELGVVRPHRAEVGLLALVGDGLAAEDEQDVRRRHRAVPRALVRRVHAAPPLRRLPRDVEPVQVAHHVARRVAVAAEDEDGLLGRPAQHDRRVRPARRRRLARRLELAPLPLVERVGRPERKAGGERLAVGGGGGEAGRAVPALARPEPGERVHGRRARLFGLQRRRWARRRRRLGLRRRRRRRQL